MILKSYRLPNVISYLHDAHIKSSGERITLKKCVPQPNGFSKSRLKSSQQNSRKTKSRPSDTTHPNGNKQA